MRCFTTAACIILLHYRFHLKKEIMSTILTALALLGFLALIVGILVYVHNRDKKSEAAQNNTISRNTAD